MSKKKLCFMKGTGKTTVIAQRIVNLVKKDLAKTEEILAVTFTEKAAFEMEERVSKLLEYGYVDLWVSTFHSFCERILRDNALDIGLTPDFKILDNTSGWLLARQNLDKFDLKYYKALGNPTKFIQALISHFSHCKDQEVYPENYLEYAESLKTTDNGPEEGETERIKEVAEAYHAYQQILLKNSALDFGDLINYCLKLFKKRPAILKKYREKFKYILVDEFQDTNWAQYELIKVLAKPNNNLTVCADDDQAIYRWRGASFSNIVQFGKDFPKAKKISLIKNYRSTQNILDQSYNFIKQNDPDRLEFQTKINKKLSADTEDQGVIEHIHAKNLDQEVGQTLKKILKVLKEDKEATYNDFAILVRANDSAIPFTRALERAGLPYQFLASRGLYSKPVILDAISYFKLLDNYHEGTAVYRILSLPFLGIPEADIAAITQYSHKKTKSLFETLQELPLIPGISAKAREKAVFILSLIKKHSLDAHEKSVSEILVAFLEDSGYLKHLVGKNEVEKIDLLNQFYKKLKNFEESTLEPYLKEFMEEMNLELESGEEGKLEFDPEKGPDMIKVMTIHGAKGLEFKYVFIVNMVDRRFPTDQRKDPIELPDELVKDIKPKGDAHLQEERRLCYVAMTRAKKGLYFTSADDYGGQRKKKLSRFLAEMGYAGKLQITNSKLQNELLAEKPKPIDRLKNKIQPQYLPQHFSYSQLAAFEKCPLQYKFAFILKVPTKGKAVFSFGKTMHNTLYEFLKLINAERKTEQETLFGKKGKPASVPLSGTSARSSDFDQLVKIFEKQWIDEWYENKKQKEDYYKLGKKIIKEFYEEFTKNKPKILKLNGQLALELPFNLKIGGHTLFGVIDRIDEEKDEVFIIDYKTGASKEKPDKEQLLIYQIATQEVLGLKPKQLAYYYLEDGKLASFLGSEKELQDQKEKIIEEIEKIKNSEFEPTPGWQCQYCDFKDICDFAQR
ncbi:MAG: UvrD-helicase domain-containing protein [Candidatus Staskawiczbacteria bacterium]|nr:UvrD-helicase domain-containing protein [Candidatus Staskawiczbacteria bacterium]